ncbi:MAG: hypothetical protein ACREQE_04260 [Candidatus Binataceae bacterium]
MAGDNVSRRLIRFWWVVAFVFGAVLGTVSTVVVGPRNAIWMITTFGLIAGAVVAVVELGGERPAYVNRALSRPWFTPARARIKPAQHKPTKDKPPARRGQLHAVTGKKIADPPSRGS